MAHIFDQADIDAIAAVEAFRALTPEDIRKLARIGHFIEVPRGADLVRQGEPADKLYYVLNGRFAVVVEGRGAVSEIRRGEPVGEIAFFRGGVRTAHVRAKRDSLVLAFDQANMDELARSAPRFLRAITASLADRLAEATPRLAARSSFRPPRTIAIAAAGPAIAIESMAQDFAAALRRFGKTQLVATENLPQRFAPPAMAGRHDITGWMEAVEDECDFAVFDVGRMDAALARTLLSGVDCILFVADANAGQERNELEKFAAQHCRDIDCRLVLLHERPAALHPGTARWLTQRCVSFHHHVVRGEAEDIARLARFITGRSLGFVASGGGAACAAHTGVYKAFRDRGVTFDIFGGTSAGAAMAAAFAENLEPDDIAARVEDIFITRRAMGRLTVPRYSLFDHKPFDEALQAHFGEAHIEDMHRPFFALATNLSTGREEIMRTGPLWQAIRASSAIPGLFPPFFSNDGDMLVDGCLLDNVPLRVMHRFNAGPNAIVAFRMALNEKFAIQYDSLPGRWRIAASMATAHGRKSLPPAPGIAEVLMRSITLSAGTELSGSAGDIVFIPPVGDEIGIMSWERHRDLMAAACDYTHARIEALLAEGNPALYGLLN